MNLQELLQLLGTKEVDIYLLRKRIAELEQELATIKGIAPEPPKE